MPNKNSNIEHLQSVYNDNALSITMMLSRMHVVQFKRLYEKFDGDILLPIIMHEIGAYPVRNITSATLDKIRDSGELRQFVYSQGSCNAFSICQSLGIPHQTMRRKLSKLEEKGYIKKNGRQIWLTDKATSEFIGDFSFQTFCNFLDVKNMIDMMLEKSK